MLYNDEDTIGVMKTLQESWKELSSTFAVSIIYS